MLVVYLPVLKLVAKLSYWLITVSPHWISQIEKYMRFLSIQLPIAKVTFLLNRTYLQFEVQLYQRYPMLVRQEVVLVSTLLELGPCRSPWWFVFILLHTPSAQKIQIFNITKVVQIGWVNNSLSCNLFNYVTVFNFLGKCSYTSIIIFYWVSTYWTIEMR